MGIGSDRKIECTNVSYFRWRGHLGILLNRLKYSHVRLDTLPAVANTELHSQTTKCIFFLGSYHCVFPHFDRWLQSLDQSHVIYQPLSLPTWLLLGRCQWSPNSSTNIGKIGVLLSNRDVKVKNLLLFFFRLSPPFSFNSLGMKMKYIFSIQGD